ncbi:MAG: hypothetical protein Sapg2KO_27530 [Saprospiraceae bacterium]
MKKILLFALFTFLSQFLFAHNGGHEGHANIREWNIEDQTIQGAFLMIKDGLVYIEIAEKGMNKYPLRQFSEKDQEFINQKQTIVHTLNQFATFKKRKKPFHPIFVVIFFSLLLFSISIYKIKINPRYRPIFLFFAILLSGSLYSFRDAVPDLFATDPLFLESAFYPFKPNINTHWDEDYFYVESNGIPEHQMMVGITAWQQQVPIPQCYTGMNAWSIPLNPVLASSPLSTEQHFMKGAIALATNGVPIFNAKNNQGIDSYLAGELDAFGGHCGRADDYHYHIAPLHLDNKTSDVLPIAFALDGFAVYGQLESDGTAMKPLDPYNGHLGANGVYHYHGTTTYPYMIGSMVGEVRLDPSTPAPEDQITPQAFAKPVRPPQSPLRGAEIVDFETTSASSYQLKYTLNNDNYTIDYGWNDQGQVDFEFINPQGNSNNSTYKNFTLCEIESDLGFSLSSPVVEPNGFLPRDYTCEGQGINPPLNWENAPEGTDCFVLTMHHIDNKNVTKTYFILYDITQNELSIAADESSIGIWGGNTQNNQLAYAPPCSQGPGLKEYIITVYALSACVDFDTTPQTTAEVLERINEFVLDSASLVVNYDNTICSYTGSGIISQGLGNTLTSNLYDCENGRLAPVGTVTAVNGTEWTVPAEVNYENNAFPFASDLHNSCIDANYNSAAEALADLDGSDIVEIDADGEVITGYVFADNYFELYINGIPVGKDKVPFTPFNSSIVRFRVNKPYTIAMKLVDWEENLGLGSEENQNFTHHLGDGGMVAVFKDENGNIDATTGSEWKAQVFYTAPIIDLCCTSEEGNSRLSENCSTENSNDASLYYALHWPTPSNWSLTAFDDSNWPNATTYANNTIGVDNKSAYTNFTNIFDDDEDDAEFIWSSNVVLDNVVLARYTVGAPSTLVNFIGSEMLGRPTNEAITINMLADTNLDLYVEYGTVPNSYTQRTPSLFYMANSPIELTINGLEPDTRYYYRVRYKISNEVEYQVRPEYQFHTQRAPGSSFSFVVQADPHLDAQSDSALYAICLENQLANEPDFMIDLGDIFMSDKIANVSYQDIVDRCLIMRSYYDLSSHSVPLFIGLGNHEGESGWKLNGTKDNIAVWATNARKLYYPNPSPNGFYTGDTIVHDFVGLRENYYGFEWGDALFLVLDPYWYTEVKPNENRSRWNWTLGETQYRWLRDALESSDATFKFIFSHTLIGGSESARGGVEFANLFEWGGQNEDGTYGFDANRPGWGKPIHQLMMDNDVTMFFHGHDHFYAKQDLDCIGYQLVPQPSHPQFNSANQASEYGYFQGSILPNAGHLKVSVNAEKVEVDYVRAYKPENENQNRKNRAISDSYSINAGECLVTATEDLPASSSHLIELVYPNPVNEKLMVQLTENYIGADVNLSIYNALGQPFSIRISKGIKTFECDMHLLPSGIYFVEIRDRKSNDSEIIKIIRK